MLQILILLHFRLSQFLYQHLLFCLKCFECAKKLTKERSLHVVAPGCLRGFSIEHQPIKKENKMIISQLYKSVNPNITNTLVVILDSNKIKCTNTYQYWVEYNINKNIGRSSQQLSQQTLLTQIAAKKASFRNKNSWHDWRAVARTEAKLLSNFSNSNMTSLQRSMHSPGMRSCF